jgi:hypothetical protein
MLNHAYMHHYQKKKKKKRDYSVVYYSNNTKFKLFLSIYNNFLISGLSKIELLSLIMAAISELEPLLMRNSPMAKPFLICLVTFHSLINPLLSSAFFFLFVNRIFPQAFSVIFSQIPS